MTFCEMHKSSGGCQECPNRYVCTDSPLKITKPKIFCGSEVFEVTSRFESYEVMDQIARKARGTFEGSTCGETGFWVDVEKPVSIGGKHHLYYIRGASGTSYAETNDRNLFL